MSKYFVDWKEWAKIDVPKSVQDVVARVPKNVEYFLPNYVVFLALFTVICLFFKPAYFFVILVSAFAAFGSMQVKKISDVEIKDLYRVAFVTVFVIFMLTLTHTWCAFIWSSILTVIATCVHAALVAPKQQ